MALHEGLTLFLVEDEALIAMDLEALVEDMGHEVASLAASVDEATEALAGLDIKPDAAIVDANLGGTSALPIVNLLKAAGIPTIIASGYTPEEIYHQGLSGIIISKPYQSATIADAINEALAAHK